MNPTKPEDVHQDDEGQSEGISDVKAASPQPCQPIIGPEYQDFGAKLCQKWVLG
jgi:hypothetical protein